MRDKNAHYLVTCRHESSSLQTSESEWGTHSVERVRSCHFPPCLLFFHELLSCSANVGKWTKAKHTHYECIHTHIFSSHFFAPSRFPERVRGHKGPIHLSPGSRLRYIWVSRIGSRPSALPHRFDCKVSQTDPSCYSRPHVFNDRNQIPLIKKKTRCIWRDSNRRLPT